MFELSKYKHLEDFLNTPFGAVPISLVLTKEWDESGDCEYPCAWVAKVINAHTGETLSYTIIGPKNQHYVMEARVERDYEDGVNAVLEALNDFINEALYN